MKRLFLIAAIAALTVMAWGQITRDATNDSVVIRINVHMEGLEWTIDTINGTGGWCSTSDVSPTWNATSDSFYTDDQEVSPCQKIYAAFWVENTGGITMDMSIYGTSGPDWTWDDDQLTCAGVYSDHTSGAADTAAFAALFKESDGTEDYADGTDPAANDVVPNGASAEAEVTNANWNSESSPSANSTSDGLHLMAEDPTATGDGTFADQDDQAEFYVHLVAPPSATNTSTQYFRVVLTGKIAD